MTVDIDYRLLDGLQKGWHADFFQTPQMTSKYIGASRDEKMQR
jgi:hypothetical protein